MATPQETQELVNSIKSKFHMFILLSLHHRGETAAKQMYIMTCLLKHKGLSLEGMHVLSTLGMGVSRRTFSREEDISLQVEQERIR